MFLPVLRAHAATVGEQRTAVLLVNFQDDTTQTITRAAAHALVFGEVSDFYWENSYQKTFLSGDTFGWFTIPVSRATCNTLLFAQEADKLATASGVDLSKYERLIYLMPPNSCTAAGANSGPVLPTRMWMMSGNLTAQSIAHELGHNFGLSHSQALECGAVSYGDSCSVKSYGDVADTMGSGPLTHFSATQKETLGWLNASGQTAAQTVTRGGTYTVAPIETAGGDGLPRALKIPRGIDPGSGQTSYYYIEYRQLIGLDAELVGVGNLTQGVLVHTGGIDQFSMLLDMTPDSEPSSTFLDAGDGALAVGRTYVDAATGIAITLTSANTSGASVSVVMETASVGTLSATVATNKTSYVRGETVAMSARVLRDGVPIAGASVSFRVADPSGRTTTLSATSGSDGYARAAFRLGKSRTAIGGYGLRAEVSSGGANTSASTAFNVR